MRRTKSLIWIIRAIIFHAVTFPSINCLTCHQCGNMYDGSTFMGIENFEECQFFEHDTVSEDNTDYLIPCPPQDKCCFILREHMTLDFWGHSAAAEVLVRGCCSQLNETKHHLVSSSPPPLVLTDAFKAEVLSQTVQNGPVKTRILFCNSLGCNNSNKVPWSKPVNAKSHAESSQNRRQSFQEEKNLIDLFESQRSSFSLKSKMSKKPKVLLTAPNLDKPKEESKVEPIEPMVVTDRTPSRCECNCNCPSLVCPSFLTSSSPSNSCSFINFLLHLDVKIVVMIIAWAFSYQIT